jgi:hypothetical protein
MATEAQHRHAIDKFRSYYDETLTRHIGARPPDPFPGQSLIDYRIDACAAFKKTYLPQNHDLYKVNFKKTRATLRDDTTALNAFLEVIEPQLLAACKVEANNPLHVPPGELKQINRLDQTGHVKMTEFIGQDCFVKQMMRPGRRVVGFKTDQGYVNTTGQFRR